MAEYMDNNGFPQGSNGIPKASTDISSNKSSGDNGAVRIQLYVDEIVNVVFRKDRESPNTARKDDNVIRGLHKAIDFIEESIKEYVDSAFKELQKVKGNLTVVMMDYGEAFAKKYFQEDLDAEKLLFFLVHTISVAYKFHQQGVLNMEYCVTTVVNNCSCNFGMLGIRLDRFRETVDKIVFIGERSSSVPQHYLDAIDWEYIANEVPDTERPSSNLEQSYPKNTFYHIPYATLQVPRNKLRSTSSSSATSVSSFSSEKSESQDSPLEDKA